MPRPAMFDVADLTRIQHELEQLPERPSEKLSRKDAVAFLAPQIRALRRKRYTLGLIAETLSAKGITVTESVLKKYLSSKSEVRSRSRQRRDKRRENAPAKADHPPVTASPSNEPSSAAPKANARATIPVDASGHKPANAPVVNEPKVPARGTFVPREDTKDI